jgi:hypothetical protein
MDCEIDVSTQERFIDVFDEARFVVEACLGFYRDELRSLTLRLEGARNRLRLRESQRTAARADSDQR